MSTTVDQRVVQMEFDNSRFERNVSTTMSTLDKLKQSLNLTGAAKGLENVGIAAKGINLTGLSSAAETVAVKFSYMQMAISNEINKIVGSAVAAGKRIASALTIDPIKTGFSEYETQINAVQTILANTSSKGKTIDDVNGALDTLNAYADKTIYNFTEMTRNIGTFTAAGVDLDTSVSAIQGIANLAAVSGSTSQQASTAMYQLSQALSSGTVRLMDWNSVVNAGMGGQVFQDALRKTSEELGTGAEAAIKAKKSFRESLQTGWLTSEVLTETLKKFTTGGANEYVAEYTGLSKEAVEAAMKSAEAQYGEASAVDKAAEALANKSGKNKEEIKQALQFAKTAEDAATKVKTFTQLWDTLKEAAQSGWTQSWEIIVGDFEEAKALLTKVSDTIGKIIGDSAEARNKLLQGWKNKGGRDDLISGLQSAFNGIMNIAKPIKEAFRDIFPPTTANQLKNFTRGFERLMQKFEDFTSKHGDKIESTFKGIFAVVDIGWTFVKELAGGIMDLISNFAGLGGGVLGATASIGDWLVSLRDGIDQTDIFGKAIDTVTGFISNIITKIKEFGGAIKEYFQTTKFEGFLTFFKGLWEVIKWIGEKVGVVFSSIVDGLTTAFGGANLADLLNSGLFAGVLVTIMKFADKLASPFEAISDMFKSLTEDGGVVENLKGILDDVRGCFEAYQNNLQADILKKIATAIAILAGSIFVLSLIDGGKLDHAVGAMTLLFGELLGALKLFTMIDTDQKGLVKAMSAMVAMSTAIIILSGALAIMGSLNANQILNGVLGIGIMIGELLMAIKAFEYIGDTKGIFKASASMILIGAAIKILASSMKDFAAMNWEEIGKGLLAMGGALAIVVAALNLLPNNWSASFGGFDAKTKTNLISAGIAMIAIAGAMKIFASAVKDFAAMQWEEIGRGLAAMAGSLAAVTLALRFMPTNTLSIGVGILAVSAALKVIASALSDFGGMTWDEIIRGLTGMGIALAELTVGLIFMSGTQSGSAALLIATAALALLVPVLKSLGNMSWGEIAKGLIAIAGAFAVIGTAAFILMPFTGTIVALAGAIALIGVAALALGAGITMISVGLTALSTSVATTATAIVAALSVIIVGIIDLIPAIVKSLGAGVLAICQVLMECAPTIAETLLVVLAEVLTALATYTPTIVDSLMTFVIGLIDGLAARLPELIVSAVNLMGAFFQGVVDALSGIDTSNLIKGIAGVGLMTALMYALSGVVALIPTAMAGVLGMGVLIAELALVLAAVGALAQIPGLQWLIDEGGDFLMSIGTAIGKFVGGIVGGIAEGATSTLPQVGTNLSDFMTNIKPFIDGAKTIDESMMSGATALVDAILALTGAGLLDTIASWLGGGDSLTEFANQLVPFGTAMKNYAAEVAGIDHESIASSVSAAKALVNVAKAIPSDGLFGTDGIDDFGKNVVSFGKSMKKYGEAVTGIDVAAVTTSVTAAKGLVQVARAIPDDGTFGTDGIDNFGDNVVSFGKSLKSYAEKVAGVSAEAITSSVNAANRIVSFIKSLSGFDGSGVDSFKDAISSLATANVSGFTKAFEGANTQLASVGSKIAESISNGFKSKMSIIKADAAAMVKAVLDTFRNNGAAFTAAGIELIMKLVNGIARHKSKIGTSITSALKTAVSAMRGYHSQFYNAGSYLVSGFANGISANQYKAAAKAKAMAAAAANAARKELDEHSPSRVGYEIGDYFGVAFVNAIGSYVKTAYDTSAEVAGSARSGLTNALSKINDYINGNMDAQPTIRPVLDLSNVQSGVGALSGMLNGSSVGVLANVGAISSMMSRHGQNGANMEVVSAIDKLGKKLDGMERATYQINGVTYDDGSNIAGAVKEIARAAIRERRM